MGLKQKLKPSESDRSDDESALEDYDRSDGSWFRKARAKYGLSVVLVGVGVVLFVIPEPITSTVGVTLMVLGAASWVIKQIV